MFSKIFSLAAWMVSGMLLLLPSEQAVAQSSFQDVVDGNNAFALQGYQYIAQRSGNLVYSPLSFSSVMSMAYFGARASTAHEMSDILHFPEDANSVGATFQSLINSLKQSGPDAPYQFAMANSVWLQKGLPLLYPFQEAMNSYYQGDLVQTDFAGNADSALQQINEWVMENSNGKIQNLLSPGDVNASTRLVLVSALSLIAPWAQPFSSSDSSKGTFYSDSLDQLEAMMLHQTGKFSYFHGDGVALLQMPYASDAKSAQLAMILLLPDNRDGMHYLEQDLNLSNWKTWTSAMSPASVKVTLPKFKIDSRVDGKDLLKKMGLQVPFSIKADFSGIDGAKDLMISAIVHRALISVDENGTEASAATAASVGAKSSAPPKSPVVFTADHPFLYAIIEISSGQILFFGKVEKPQG